MFKCKLKGVEGKSGKYAADFQPIYFGTDALVIYGGHSFWMIHTWAMSIVKYFEYHPWVHAFVLCAVHLASFI